MLLSLDHPVEQEKQLKYAGLVANTVMLSNVADFTAVIADMAKDGQPVTPELVAATFPYERADSPAGLLSTWKRTPPKECIYSVHLSSQAWLSLHWIMSKVSKFVVRIISQPDDTEA